MDHHLILWIKPSLLPYDDSEWTISRQIATPFLYITKFNAEYTMIIDCNPTGRDKLGALFY